MAALQIKKVSWWHERLCDYMIANPHATLGEIAVALDKSQTWISIVKNSDVFQDYWRERSDHHSEQVTQVIKAKAFAASEMALDAINAKLEENAALMTTAQLLEVVDVTQKRFGSYGDAARSAPQFNVNLGLVTPEQLKEARERLRATDKEPKVIEHIEQDVVEASVNELEKLGE